MLDTAPVAVAVALDSEKADTWQADGAIAALNLQLAATDEGLGACWCHILERDNAEERVRQAFGIPQNLRVLCLVTIGHKDEERQQYDLQKLPYQKIHFTE
jgi:nitroreductase